MKGKGLTEKSFDPEALDGQKLALQELEDGDFLTAIAWRIKEKLRWVRQAQTLRAARWRMTHFLNHARSMLTDAPELEAIRKALNTLETHIYRILLTSDNYNSLLTTITFPD